jgi:hypothetical protein
VSSIHEFRGIPGIPISASYVNFQEFSSIFKRMLLPVREEHAEDFSHISFLNRFAVVAGSFARPA